MVDWLGRRTSDPGVSPLTLVSVVTRSLHTQLFLQYFMKLICLRHIMSIVHIPSVFYFRLITYFTDLAAYTGSTLVCDLLPNLNFLSLFVSGISFFKKT